VDDHGEKKGGKSMVEAVRRREGRERALHVGEGEEKKRRGPAHGRKRKRERVIASGKNTDAPCALGGKKESGQRSIGIEGKTVGHEGEERVVDPISAPHRKRRGEGRSA